MDSTEKCLLAALAALSLGVVIGWHLRMDQRRKRAAGASPTTAMVKGSSAPAPGSKVGSSHYNRPIGGSSSSCACAS